MSDLVDDTLTANLLEDLEDIADWCERKNGETVGYEDFVSLQKGDGVIQGRIFNEGCR
ncbi:MAG: hypothetical protein ACI8Z5_002402 [Lentimonas sp.]|jgi:hypothetical protein